MASDPWVEIRGEIAREHVDVIDAVVQATPGASRLSVLRQIIAEWVEHECHKASLIERVRRGNGTAPEPDRKRAGGGRG